MKPIFWISVAVFMAQGVSPAQEPAAAVAGGRWAADEAEREGRPSGEPRGLPSVLDLGTAKAIAIRDNPSLKAAAERAEQARARVTQARASYFPTITAGASVSTTWIDENTYRTQRQAAFLGPLQRVSSSRAGGAGGSSLESFALSGAAGLIDAVRARAAVPEELTTYGAVITVEWLLFNGLSREFGHAAARFAEKQSEAGYVEARRLLLASVAKAYYAAALAREEITIAEADEAFNRRQLEEAEARRRVGTGSLSDVLNFEVRVNTARASLIRARENYAVARVALAYLLGLPDGELPAETELAPLEDESPRELERPEEEALKEYALGHRPDLLENQHGVRRAKAEVRNRQGVFFPTVTASASKRASLVEDPEIGQDDFATTVGLTVAYPLFAGGRNWARVVEAKAAHREAERHLDAAEIAVAAEIHDAVERVRAAQEQLWLQRANAAFVQRNRDLVEKEYQAGQASLVRLNEAQRDLVSAQGQLALARVSLRLTWHDLHTATGTTLEPFAEEE